MGRSFLKRPLCLAAEEFKNATRSRHHDSIIETSLHNVYISLQASEHQIRASNHKAARQASALKEKKNKTHYLPLTETNKRRYYSYGSRMQPASAV